MEHIPNEPSSIQVQIDSSPNNRPDRTPLMPILNILNITLADESVLGAKTRYSLQNVHGAGYKGQHTLFKAQYKHLSVISDMISKQIRELGGLPIGGFVEFLKYTRLEEHPGIISTIMDLFNDHAIVIRFLREDAKKCEDPGTSNFLLNILSQHEKMARILRTHIEPQLTHNEITAAGFTPSHAYSNTDMQTHDDRVA